MLIDYENLLVNTLNPLVTESSPCFQSLELRKDNEKKFSQTQECRASAPKGPMS